MSPSKPKLTTCVITTAPSPLTLVLSLMMLGSFKYHFAQAQDGCVTKHLVSENRASDTYQNGSVQIQMYAKEIGSGVSILNLCLIKNGGFCYPKSIELAKFMQYLLGELVPEQRNSGKGTDPNDLFYDDPDEDAQEAAIDKELQRQLVKASDGLRSLFCVSRNCDHVKHTCSSEVRPEFVWDYHQFNSIRTKIKNRRKESLANSKKNNEKVKSHGNRLSLTIALLSCNLVILLNTLH